MRLSLPRVLVLSLCLGAADDTPLAAEPVHEAIDRLVLAKAAGQPVSPPAGDAEFLRRAYLDLAGTIPDLETTRAFLADTSPDKRAKLIDRLLAAPEYATRMQEAFHVMLMERLGDHPEWTKYLRDAFAANKPWDAMARDMLRGVPEDESARGAVFFLSKRLENYGQNPVDYSALTRDVGRLFLGKDLQCAECHDHLFVDEYEQRDFQGLFAFVRNVSLADARKPAVAERPTTEKLSFTSALTRERGEVGPKLPALMEVAIPEAKKGEEYKVAPDRKTKEPGVLRFSTLETLARQLPAKDNPDFARNAVNRVWFLLLGRGLVHPLDLHHKDNPPSHPELLDLLAEEFVAHGFDIKWLVREIALSETYQRSSLLPEGVENVPEESFRTALEKRLIAEQLRRAMLVALDVPAPEGEKRAALDALFAKAFANPAREPEEAFAPSLKAALFVLNDRTVQAWLEPKPGNLIDRMAKEADAGRVAEELYLRILTRLPSDEERATVREVLEKAPGEARAGAVGRVAWALVASTEFCVNH